MKKIIITEQNKDDYYHTNKEITTFDKITTRLVVLLFALFAGGCLYAELIKKFNPALFSLILLPIVIILVVYIFIDANNNNMTELD